MSNETTAVKLARPWRLSLDTWAVLLAFLADSLVSIKKSITENSNHG